ncbi:MAG: hypothetical protein GXO26_09175, partial [Crenarchaeota archaeon]|nr:hypothetical protein [Thermoproteota archaeon]
MSTCDVGFFVEKPHLYIDCSYRLHDLRGRNFVNNVVQYCFVGAVSGVFNSLGLCYGVRRCGGGRAVVRVFSDLSKDVIDRVLGLASLLSILVRPAGAGLFVEESASRRVYRLFSDFSVISIPCTVSGRCAICGRSSVFRSDFSEYFRHVLRDEDLCPICAISRFVGRVLNNPVVATFHGVVTGDNARNIICDLERAGSHVYSSTGDAVFIELKHDASLLGFLALRHTVWNSDTTILNDVAFLAVSIGDVAYLSAIIGLRKLKSIPHLEKEFKNVRDRLRMFSFLYQEPIENLVDRYDIYSTLCELRSVVNNLLCAMSSIVREAVNNVPCNNSVHNVLKYLERCSYVSLSPVPMPDGFPRDSLILNPLFTYVNLYGVYDNIDVEVLQMFNPLMGISVIRADGDRFGKVNDLNELLSRLGVSVPVSEELKDEWRFYLEKVLSEDFKGLVTQLTCALTPSIVVYFGGDENFLICTRSGDDISYIRDVIYLVRNL